MKKWKIFIDRDGIIDAIWLFRFGCCRDVKPATMPDGDMVFTVHNVDWYYKVEEKAIKLKWDRQYVRRREKDPLVFEDLTISSMPYSIGPAAGYSHNRLQVQLC